ncbi:MAG: alpha/beta fold hydrolase [Sphingomicrobium sp.]
MKHAVRRLAAAALVLYAVVLLMFSLQTHFIFPTHAVGPAGPLPKGAERLKLDTPDGETLHGMHIRPLHGNGDGTLILSFAGNAWNSQEAASYIHQIYPDVDVIGFHYRGYRPSTGEPSADALLDDAVLVHDFAVDRLKAERVVAVGFSIGTGVAAHLASQRKLDGLILVTPFDSLKAVAAGHYPLLPIGALFRHEMDSVAALKKISTPTAIIAAENDSLIMPARTEALRKAVKTMSYDETIPGAGHNDIYHRSAFKDAMREALAAVTR